MKEELDWESSNIGSEKSEKIEDLRERLKKTKSEIDNLLDSHSDYVTDLFKFSIASWTFGLSLFVSFILIYYGPTLVLNPPPLTVSFLIVGLASAFIVSAGFLVKKRKRIEKLREKRKKFETIYQKNLLEAKWKKTKEREEFLHSLLRHDVRNKVQVIEGYLEFLEDYDLPEGADEIVEKAEDETTKSFKLIKKVRTLMGTVREEETSEVNIGNVLRKVIEDYEDKLNSNGMNIESDITDFEVEAGDLLKELFSNILENCIVHSNGDKVRIKTLEDNGEIVCKIEDDGKGIPDENKNKIFERGFKEEEEAGTGLGMYLVEEIAKNYGGDVEVKDSDLGGSRFDVYFDRA